MEKFFYIVRASDKAELIEFLHRRYHDVKGLYDLDVQTFAEVLKLGKQQEEREYLHRQWVSMLPKMSSKELKYIPFEEYIDQCTGRNIDMRPAEEIIKELEELHGKKIV